MAIDKLAQDTLYRCQAALELWRTGQFDRILVSGGICFPREIQTRPASESMKQWLSQPQQGVDKNQIICESKSLTSFGNVEFSLKKLTEVGIDQPQITVVSQWQHAIRMRIAFSLVYGIKVERYPLHYPISFSSWLYEWFLILYHLWDWEGIGFLAHWMRRKRKQT